MWSQAFQLLFLPILLHYATAAFHLETPDSGPSLVTQREHTSVEPSWEAQLLRCSYSSVISVSHYIFLDLCVSQVH